MFLLNFTSSSIKQTLNTFMNYTLQGPLQRPLTHSTVFCLIVKTPTWSLKWSEQKVMAALNSFKLTNVFRDLLQLFTSLKAFQLSMQQFILSEFLIQK